MNRIAGVNKSASHYIICCEIVIQEQNLTAGEKSTLNDENTA